jgi:hypothetical protein
VDTKQEEYKRYNDIYTSLKEDFEFQRNTFIELRDYLAPQSGMFYGESDLYLPPNTSRLVYDEDPISFLDVSSKGLFGGLVNPSTSWFEVVPTKSNNYDYELGQICEEIKAELDDSLNRSNFYDIIGNMISELLVFNVAACLVYEDEDTDFTFSPLTIGEYYLGLDDKGDPTRLGRRVYMRPYQIEQKFGKAIPENLKTVSQYSPSNKFFEVKHLIMKIDSGYRPSDVASNAKFFEIYWYNNLISNTSEILRVKGFKSNPLFIFLGQRKNLQTVYPIGIGHRMLPAVKQLQKDTYDKQIHKAFLVQPPLALHTSIANKPILPGSKFFTDNDTGKVASELYKVNAHIQELSQDIDLTKARLRTMALTDLFLQFATNTKRMTTQEVAQISQEQMTLLAPLFMQFSKGFMTLFDRLIDIKQRKGAIRKFEPGIVKPHFISKIAKAQRLVELNNGNQLFQYVAGMSQIKPSAADILDFDKAGRKAAAILGETELTLSPNKVAEAREAQAQFQQQQMELQNKAEQAKIAKDLAKAGQTGVTAQADAQNNGIDMGGGM